jgi:single-strand DNA-binding protein
MSLNKAMIIGNLGRDPEMRYTPSGQAVTQFTVAVNRNYKDSNGDWQEETEWFRVVAWAALAERTAEYLRKGRKVYVEGRLQTRSWEDQNGQKRYTTELIANTVTPLDPRPRDEGDPGPGGFARSGDRGAASGDRAEGRAPAAAPAGRGGGGGDSGPAFDDAGDLDDLPF